MKYKKFRFLFIALIVVLLVEILSWSKIFGHFEAKLYDLVFSQRGPKETSGKVTIVAINEETMQSLGLQWPLPRSLYVNAIRNIKKAGAKGIVFDIQFPDIAKIQLGDDELVELESLINESLKEDDIQLGVTSVQDSVIMASKIESFANSKRFITPNKHISKANPDLGLVSIYTDHDDVLRHYPLFEDYHGQTYYSLAVKAYYKYFSNTNESPSVKGNSLVVGDLAVNFINNRSSIINYKDKAGAFGNDFKVNANSKYYSFIDFINKEETSISSEEDDFFSDIEVSPEVQESLQALGMNPELVEKSNLDRYIEDQVFKDKVVFIGSTLQEHHDIFNTPVGLMPGVEIHANFLDSMLTDQVLKYVNPYWIILSLLLIAILISYLCSKVSATRSLLFIIAFLILQYSSTMGAFKYSNLVIPQLQYMLVSVIIYLIFLVLKYVEEQKAKKEIRNTFEHYMSNELVEELVSNPENLTYGGSVKDISVLFSDIRSFTTYTESHSMEDTVSMLREYLTEMTKVVIDNKGIIDKFVGDEIMVLYGTPVEDKESAINACRTALQMRVRLNELHEKWRAEGKDIFEIGIGVNSGKAVVGNLGSEQVFDYTAIGDNINLGARLEALNKNYDTETKIIISEFTLERVKDRAIVEYLDDVKVKGKNKAVKIYNLKELN